MVQSAFQPRRSFLELILLELRILFFCAYKEELLSLGKREFFFSSVLVLLAGFGRAWHTAAPNLIIAALTSWGYVLCLGMYLWVLLALIGAKEWRFGRVLTFIGMTAPAAWIHAIPLERMLDPYAAEQAGMIIFLVVTVWRIALLAWFAGQLTSLGRMRIAVALFLPIALVMNLAVWADEVSNGIGRLGGARRQLRKQGSYPQTNASSTANQFGGFGDAGGSQFNSSTAGGGINDFSHPAVTGNHRRKAVTAAPTTWLSGRGEQLATQQDSPGLTMNLVKPTYTETINTPQGPVEIYSDITLGGPSSPIPDGFEEVPPDDVILNYKHPLTKLISPLAFLSLWLSIPAGFAYLVYIFCRPKRTAEDEEQTGDDEEGDDQDD
ncbi:MAG: hypothetical protein K2W95_13655 [Candidatus Obscuribacterales bacterium]|nr:hypothetical protein [Candidatus Obscuribacterales bacterium]